MSHFNAAAQKLSSENVMAQLSPKIDAIDSWLQSHKSIKGVSRYAQIQSILVSPEVEEYLSSSSPEFIEILLNEILKNINLGETKHRHPSMITWPFENTEIKVSFDYKNDDRRVIIKQLELLNPVVTRALLEKELLNDEMGDNAPGPAFKLKASQPLCIPDNGVAKLYPGKRTVGDIRAWLASAYPFRQHGEPLTLSWLESYDRKAYRALYNQSTTETGPPSDFLPSLSRERDELLGAHGIDLSTPDGVEKARLLHSTLTSRLYPKRKLSR